jgi:hypothetical protein
LPQGHFDVVCFHTVWMTLPTGEACIEVLGNIGRLLASGGTLCASVTHPCFRDRAGASFRTDFDPVRYREDGTPFRSTIFDGTREITVVDFHWSLAAMSRQLRGSGFVIEELEEIDDRGEPGGKPEPGCPWLVVWARRPD